MYSIPIENKVRSNLTAINGSTTRICEIRLNFDESALTCKHHFFLVTITSVFWRLKFSIFDIVDKNLMYLRALKCDIHWNELIKIHADIEK